MQSSLLDTNVIVRFFVEDPQKTSSKYRGVFTFFARLETGEIAVELPELIVFETFFVLTSVYGIPAKEAASKLDTLICFRGIHIQSLSVLRQCLRLIQAHHLSLVDAYLVALAKEKSIHSIYSYDADFLKQGLKSLEIA